MTRTHRRTATLLATTGLALGLGLGGLSACSQADPAPKFAEEPSASPTPEAKETAEEFIRRWNDEQNRLMKGTSETWRTMTAQCRSCSVSADRVDEYYAAGGYVRTKGRTVLSVEDVTKSEDSPIRVYRVEIDSAPTTYRASSSAPEQRLPGGVSTYEVRLEDAEESWAFVDYWEIAS